MGLCSEPEAIANCIGSHPLRAGQRIGDAELWSDSQAAFLRSALLADAEWAVKVDSLAVSLGAG